MNTKEALLQLAEYPPMTVRDLTGTVRKQVIQVDVMRLEQYVCRRFWTFVAKSNSIIPENWITQMGEDIKGNL